MSDNQYPVFESGQTLTAADLNMVRAFLHQRDRSVGRMTGFGVNCGLGGIVSSNTLAIQPGLAVDQYGEPLVLPTARTIALPPSAMTPSYDFIDTVPGGFSVVLEASDTVEPAPDCGEADCAGHAELHTRDVVLRTVSGRVTGTRMDFAGESLLTMQPIALAIDGTPLSPYNPLRDAIATRLTNGGDTLVAPALITKLQGTSIVSTEPAATKGYKCGWLNMVLFATLDLLRVEALLKLGCDRSTTRPGVVLGWVHQVGGVWVFDCAYRHAWEPPLGLTEAFLGGTCTDPASRYRSELESLLAGYAPPVPPPSGGGSLPDPVFCPRGSFLIGGRCYNIFYPPFEIPEHWRDPWLIDPLGPVWNPPESLWKEPWTIYEVDGWNFFDDGVISVGPYVGQSGDLVKDVLTNYIAGNGGIADVRVVGIGEAEDLPGYSPAGGFSPSDSMVLTVDSKGMVVGTGRVPAVRNTRNVGAALPAAIDAAADAQAAAVEMRGIAATVESRFTTLNGNISKVGNDLKTLTLDFNAYKGGAFDQGGFGARIASVETRFDEVRGHGERIADLEGRVQILGVEEVRGHGERIADLEGKVDIIAKQPTGITTKGMDVAVGQGIAKFAETTLAAMRSLPVADSKDFAQRMQAVESSQAQLASAITAGSSQAVATAALGVLGTVGTMVKAAGVSPELGQQLDAQLNQLGGLVG